MSRDRRVVLCVIGVVCLGICLFLLTCEPIRDGAHSYIANSLRNIGLALHNYQSVRKGRLPPPVVKDKNGRPLYSWRVLLLPYLEHEPLYKQFKLDEPWD